MKFKEGILGTPYGLFGSLVDVYILWSKLLPPFIIGCNEASLPWSPSSDKVYFIFSTELFPLGRTLHRGILLSSVTFLFVECKVQIVWTQVYFLAFGQQALGNHIWSRIGQDWFVITS